MTRFLACAGLNFFVTAIVLARRLHCIGCSNTKHNNLPQAAVTMTRKNFCVLFLVIISTCAAATLGGTHAGINGSAVGHNGEPQISEIPFLYQCEMTL